MQGFLFDQIGPNPGQVALWHFRKAGEKQMRDGQIQDGVAEKFEPLVVIRGETAMRQCLLQESQVRERMLKARLKRSQPIAGHDTIGAAGRPPANLDVRFI